MSKKNLNEENNAREVNTDFIQERIKAHPMSRKKMIKRMVWVACMAAVFGAVACLFFLLLTPVISNMMNPQEAVVGVSYPEETASEELTPEDIRDNEERMESEQEELIREEVEKVLGENDVLASDYQSVYASLRNIAVSCNPWLVTVTTISEDYDWFNNSYENEGTTSGFVIAKSDSSSGSGEILIMTCIERPADNEKITVTFDSGATAEAKFRGSDARTNMTVLEVDADDLDESDLDKIEVAQLGSSVGNRLVGAPIIAVGNPTSDDGGIIYGTITSNSTVISLVDSNYKQITTDIYSSTGASGVIIDLSGYVVGMIDMKHNRSDMPNMLCAIGITEIKDLIETLSVGDSKPYIGIIYSDVPTGVREENNVPEGVYISRVETDSPAMEAGLQNGDLIISYDEKEITSSAALTRAILSSEIEQQVQITVLRASGDGYTEMEFSCLLR